MADICRQLTERFEKTVAGKLEMLRNEYDEARRDYADSGYDRYWNRMNRLSTEIEKLEGLLYHLHGTMSPEELRSKKEEKELRGGLAELKRLRMELTDDDFTTPKVNAILKKIDRM